MGWAWACHDILLRWAFPCPEFHLLRLLRYQSCYLPCLCKLGCKTYPNEVEWRHRGSMDSEFNPVFSNDVLMAGDKGAKVVLKEKGTPWARENSANNWCTTRPSQNVVVASPKPLVVQGYDSHLRRAGNPRTDQEARRCHGEHHAMIERTRSRWAWVRARSVPEVKPTLVDCPARPGRSIPPTPAARGAWVGGNLAMRELSFSFPHSVCTKLIIYFYLFGAALERQPFTYNMNKMIDGHGWMAHGSGDSGVTLGPTHRDVIRTWCHAQGASRTTGPYQGLQFLFQFSKTVLFTKIWFFYVFKF